MTSKEAKNPVRSLERGARILELIKELDGARLAELASRIDLSKGMIHSYLATLEQCGLVSQEGKTYTLGLGCLTLGGYARATASRCTSSGGRAPTNSPRARASWSP